QRQAEDPTLAGAGLAAQHVLDEALAAGHLGKALLVGGDAPDLVVRERRAPIARGALVGVEPFDLGFEAAGVADRLDVELALARAQILRRTDAGRALDSGRKRLVACGIDDQP